MKFITLISILSFCSVSFAATPKLPLSMKCIESNVAYRSGTGFPRRIELQFLRSTKPCTSCGTTSLYSFTSKGRKSSIVTLPYSNRNDAFLNEITLKGEVPSKYMQDVCGPSFNLGSSFNIMLSGGDIGPISCLACN